MSTPTPTIPTIDRNVLVEHRNRFASELLVEEHNLTMARRAVANGEQRVAQLEGSISAIEGILTTKPKPAPATSTEAEKK